MSGTLLHNPAKFYRCSDILFFQSGYGPADIGYVVRSNSMREVVEVVRKSTNESTVKKLEKVRQARHLYTYSGLLDQIEKWFTDPFGDNGGYLRCKNDGKKLTMASGLSSL